MAKVEGEEVEYIELLKDEGGGLLYEEGIATISFYKGDFKKAVDALRIQFRAVITANPWLAGQLVTRDGKVTIRHSSIPSVEEIDKLFTSTSADDTAAFKLSSTSTYVKTCNDMYNSQKVIVAAGSSLLDQNKPLCILTLSESKPGEFALIFSITHAIADGRTYYEVLQMLTPGSRVWSMTTERIQTFSETMRDQCGRKELEWGDTTSTACLYTCAMVPAMFGCSRATRCVAFEVDSNRVTNAKEAAVSSSKGEVSYVTTNDILTSAFFNECSTRIGMMGMDCRTRIDNISKDLAGNYVTVLTMDQDTFGTPAAVRKMLSSTPHQTTMRPLPSCCKWMCCRDSAKFAMSVNWATFAGNIVTFDECELSVHLPVHNPAYVMFDLMVPFALGGGKTGVMCWTVSSDEDGLRNALPVGDCVSRDLFPVQP